MANDGVKDVLFGRKAGDRMKFMSTGGRVNKSLFGGVVALQRDLHQQMDKMNTLTSKSK